MVPMTAQTASPGSTPVPFVDHHVLDQLDPDHVAPRFATHGYLSLPGLLDRVGLAALRAEVDNLYAALRRRDFDMDCMGGSPRHMSTLGGIEISELAPSITDVYTSPALTGRLGKMVGLHLELADDPVERHVLNRLHEAGDTHGLHTDDYPLALVMFLESPTCEQGCGHLEFFDVCQAGHSSVLAHRAGDAYLLRADQLPHRVRPIHDGCVRTVLNFAYGVREIPVKRTPSASKLYS